MKQFLTSLLEQRDKELIRHTYTHTHKHTHTHTYIYIYIYMSKRFMVLTSSLGELMVDQMLQYC